MRHIFADLRMPVSKSVDIFFSRALSKLHLNQGYGTCWQSGLDIEQGFTYPRP